MMLRAVHLGNLVVENPAKSHDGRAESKRRPPLRSSHLAVSVDVGSLVRLHLLLVGVHAIS